MAQLRRLKDEHSVDFLTRAAKQAGPNGYVETVDGPLCANCAPFGDVAPEIRWLMVSMIDLSCYNCPAGSEKAA